MGSFKNNQRVSCKTFSCQAQLKELHTSALFFLSMLWRVEQHQHHPDSGNDGDDFPKTNSTAPWCNILNATKYYYQYQTVAIICCFPQRRNMIWKTCGGISPLHVPCLSFDAVSKLAVGWTCNNQQGRQHSVLARQNSVKSGHLHSPEFQNVTKMQIIYCALVHLFKIRTWAGQKYLFVPIYFFESRHYTSCVLHPQCVMSLPLPLLR